jgi:hypothetical protein
MLTVSPVPPEAFVVAAADADDDAAALDAPAVVVVELPLPQPARIPAPMHALRIPAKSLLFVI